MIYLWNFTCAFLFLAGGFQPQWLELSQELGKAEFGSTSANDVFWSGICHQLNYPDCMWLQKENLAARAAQLSSYSGAGPGLMPGWEGHGAKHPNGSGRSQSRPMQTYPLRLSSVLKLRGLALKQYHPEHRASSGFGMCQS